MEKSMDKEHVKQEQAMLASLRDTDVISGAILSEQEFVAVYADGGCIQSNPSPIGGTWAFCLVDAEGKRIREHGGILEPKCFESGLVSNNNSELYALVKAILSLPLGWEGTIYSDSHVSLLRVFRNAKMNGVPDWLAETTGLARARLKHLKFKYVLLDGHPTKAQLATGKGKRGNPCSEHNVFCDKKCTEVGKAYVEKQKTLHWHSCTKLCRGLNNE
jgi:ribonuclease HI